MKGKVVGKCEGKGGVPWLGESGDQMNAAFSTKGIRLRCEAEVCQVKTGGGGGGGGGRSLVLQQRQQPQH